MIAFFIKRAANNLMLMYFNGKCIPADKKEAITYFMIAADEGLKQSCREYSLMFYCGKNWYKQKRSGTLKDYTRWYY